MCGIIGVAGALNALDEKIYKELLHADVVRGKHATGMVLVKGKCREVFTHKRALASPLYLELGSVNKALTGFAQNSVAIGHNRHATMGNSSDPEGAHPFSHGDITLVHNGSLTSHNTLTTDYFPIDSEAICKAISVDGIELVVPKLRGAFTLVWIDKDKDTLNFFRNSQRPMAIAWDSVMNKMWWASERDMLEWSLNRDTLTRSPIHYDTCFELPVGQWLSIPITNLGVDISKAERKDLDVTNSVYVAPVNNYNYYPPAKNTVVEDRVDAIKETVTHYLYGPTRERALAQVASKTLEDRGRHNTSIREFISTMDMDSHAPFLDARLGFTDLNWECYKPISSQGKITGTLTEYPHCEVEVHGVTAAEFDKLNTNSKGNLTAYITGFIVPPNYKGDVETFGLILRKDSIRFLPSASLPFLEDWEVKTAGGCCYCEELPRSRAEANKVTWLDQESYSCESCTFEMENGLELESYSN